MLLPTTHILPHERHGIVINLPQLRLYYFENAEKVLTFPIGIGMEGWQTPTGKTEITLKRRNPVWIPPESIRRQNPDLPEIVPAGPNNPLGAYALNLGWDGFRIHGTNRPQGVGKRSSHGCIRLYPEDIKALFALVRKGTPVTVIDESLALGWREGTLYLEVTPTQKQADEIAAYKIPQPAEMMGSYEAIGKAVNDPQAVIDWYAVISAFAEQNGIPVPITEK